MNDILKIAHRSGPTIYPEQTVQSALNALMSGADIVEIDVRFTKDKTLVVCHDDNAERIFGVNKNICDMSADEFLSLRHKDNNEFSAHLFTDYLSAKVKPILIHIKQDDVIDEMLKELNEFHYDENDVIFGVSNIESVNEIRGKWTNSKILAFSPNYEMRNEFINAKVNYFRVWEDWIDKFDVELNFPTFVMTNACGVGYTTKERLDKLKKLNISGILINDITKL